VDIQQLSVKIMARPGDGFDHQVLIPVFHRWIRNNTLGDVLLIDVADYRHVPSGPGVMLIAHHAHYGLDGAGGELGLLFARKRDSIGPAAPRIREGLAAAIDAAQRLAGEPEVEGTLRFDYGRIELRVMSRLIADNSAASVAAFIDDLVPVVGELYGIDSAGIELTHGSDPKQPLTVRMAISSDRCDDPETLLARLRDVPEAAS